MLINRLLEGLVRPKLACEVIFRFVEHPDSLFLQTQDGVAELKYAYHCCVKVTSQHTFLLYFLQKRTLMQLEATLCIDGKQFQSIITKTEEPIENIDALPSDSSVDHLHVGGSCYTAYFLIDPINHTTFVLNPYLGERTVYQKLPGIPKMFWLKLRALHEREYKFQLDLPDTLIERLTARSSSGA